MKFTKLMAVILSLVIAATAMLACASAVTIEGTVEEGDVTGIEIDLGSMYPVLLDPASWAAGVEVQATYTFENEIVPTLEDYGTGCGGNMGLYIKYGEQYTWKDKNSWAYNDVWMLDKGLEYNKVALTYDTEGAEIMEAGVRFYNFQQSEDNDLDDQLVGNGITVEIVDILVGGESILGDEEDPTEEDPTEEEPTEEDPTEEEPTEAEPTEEEPTEEEPTEEEPTEEEPEGAYLKATVDSAEGTVTLSTVNFPEDCYGLQYTIAYSGATFAELSKGMLPEGWAETYPKAAEMAEGFTAVLDCDFSEALGDQDILVINFTDVADLAVTLSAAKGVNGDFAAIAVDTLVVEVEPEEPTEEEPTEEEPTEEEPTEEEPTEEEPTEEEPTEEEPTEVPTEEVPSETEIDTTTEVPGDTTPGDVDTGVIGFASILGVVTLAGAVASKKR